ncbi:uncharacterized protein [Onthophagus taurus]|uniref:uncharacterized protein n=1 Tax=Onthophagus taurus TaxID=166361 RepID=UPI000C1FF20C|nr:uncharacterized protein LOC111419944 [Onthophagus taurus]XP_022908598.1 uncharacterized protein LOC111419944 [Onthophagus taurus]
MRHKFIFKTTLLFLITASVVLSFDSTSNQEQNNQHKIQKRASQKPGFFKTLFSVIYEQWADTKDTVNTVSKMVNENIIDDREAARRKAKTEPPPTNGSTTEAPYMLTRSELNRILRRNLKGLLRLYNIELNDALKTSYRNNKEWRKNVSSEVSKYL